MAAGCVRIRELLDLGRYMPGSELSKASSFEKMEIAQLLWYLRQDFSEEIDGKYLPIISAIYAKRQGFPKESEEIKSLLESEEKIDLLINELSDFDREYQKNKGILRFHNHEPKDLISKLIDLKREKLVFTANADFQPKRQFFITRDEIEKLLRGGKNNSDYRISLYRAYQKDKTKESIEKFLKRYHGEYSGYAGGNDQYSFRGKGLLFSHVLVRKG